MDTSFTEIQLKHTVLCRRCCQESTSGNTVHHHMDVSLSNANDSDALALQELVVGEDFFASNFHSLAPEKIIRTHVL